MKMNIRKLLRDGNKGKPISLVLIFLSISLIGSFFSFIYDHFIDYGLHAINQLFIIYFAKWIYVSILIWALINLNKKPHLSWLLINAVSLSIILLSFVSNFLFLFYSSFIDIVLLGFISVFLLVYTNINSFIKKYLIIRRPIYFLFIILFSGITTYSLYIILEYIINNCDTL